ncbi:GlcNAc-PI de-N-acetylase [Mycobacterium sp. ITM-2017-0098]|nr:GlcNAc-PI de-N-acetylase [Mycobacterium sp. ITM-2017-0098]
MSDPNGRVPVLMVVHAHPDDESSSTGGTLARYSALGYRTILVTCTDGRQGDATGGAKPGQTGHDPHEVAQRRADELDAAAAALGITEVVKLRYPDSGVDDDCAEEAFSTRPVSPLVHQLVRLMRIYRPDVVITYPPNGLSGHPDHIRTHDIVVAAHADVVAAGDSPALYYIALSRSRVKAFQANARAAFGDDGWAPPDDMAVDDAMVTTVIDVGSHLSAKLAGLAAHSSQADAAMLLHMFSARRDLDARGGDVEEYIRVYPPTAGAAAEIERDLFGLVRLHG